MCLKCTVANAILKPVDQIVEEWVDIEANNPAQSADEILKRLAEPRALGLTTDRENDLIDIINELSQAIVSYHIEMGTLIKELE